MIGTLLKKEYLEDKKLERGDFIVMHRSLYLVLQDFDPMKSSKAYTTVKYISQPMIDSDSIKLKNMCSGDFSIGSFVNYKEGDKLNKIISPLYIKIDKSFINEKILKLCEEAIDELDKM